MTDTTQSPPFEVVGSRHVNGGWQPAELDANRNAPEMSVAKADMLQPRELA